MPAETTACDARLDTLRDMPVRRSEDVPEVQQRVDSDVKGRPIQRARIVGKLTWRSTSDYNVQLRCELTRATVQAEGEFCVSGRNEMAEAISATTEGSTVEVEGEIIVHNWTTGDKKEHVQWEILASRWKILSTK